MPDANPSGVCECYEAKDWPDTGANCRKGAGLWEGKSIATKPQHGPGPGAPPRPLAYGGLTLATLAAATSSIFIRLSSAGPLAIAFWRLALTVAILAVPLLWRHRRELQALGRRDLALAMAAGVFLALHFATWIASLRMTSVAVSTVLVSTHPFLVVALGARLFGERVPTRAVAGAGAAVLGAALVGWGDAGAGPDALLGDLLAFLGAVTVTGYFLIGRALRQRIGLLPYTVTVYSAAALVLLAGALAAGERVVGYGARDWALFLALAAFPTILGHTVLNWALRYVRAAVASVAWLGEPLGAAVLALVLFGELPGPLSLLGGGLILTGIFGFIRATER